MSYIIAILTILQVLVVEQVLPSNVTPFNKSHEDLIMVLLFCTFFIVNAIESLKKDE